uniref:Uncharacterized protein n=2 Tax=Arundo donax TaxID=35708 RepID=A0A0A9BV22_ARUDO
MQWLRKQFVQQGQNLLVIYSRYHGRRWLLGEFLGAYWEDMHYPISQYMLYMLFSQPSHSFNWFPVFLLRILQKDFRARFMNISM